MTKETQGERREDSHRETTRRRIVWEWLAPLGIAAASGGLVEVGHLALVPWIRVLLCLTGWSVVWGWYSAMWQRWRSAEIDRIARRRLGAPRITLIVGQDLHAGEVCVVNERGFVVAPDEAAPLPPPIEPTRVTARRGRP